MFYKLQKDNHNVKKNNVTTNEKYILRKDGFEVSIP